MNLSNGEKINQNVYEFDVLLKSTGDDFELTSYQAALSFDTSIAGGANIIFTYLENTSELNNIPSTGIGVNTSGGKAKLTFASFPSSEIIGEQVKRIGRFRLECSNSFDINPSVNWNFQGNIATIITGTAFENITNPSNHISDIGGINQIEVSQVAASGTPDAGTAPEKTIDGLGYYDSDPLSRWAVMPMPQWISYDLGSEKLISTVKIAFANFHLNRIYQYSVSVSTDNLNWTEIVTNASSVPEEWTTAEFSQVSARYVKIDLISSTNNPNQWANIWETEIWGENKSTSVETIDDAQPTDFELLQNYPNPFNPTTKIRFSLPENKKVKLTVFNILGEAVSELVNEEMTMGLHEVNFDAGNLASGIYVYRLDVENQFSDIKKMILLK